MHTVRGMSGTRLQTGTITFSAHVRYVPEGFHEHASGTLLKSCRNPTTGDIPPRFRWKGYFAAETLPPPWHDTPWNAVGKRRNHSRYACGMQPRNPAGTFSNPLPNTPPVAVGSDKPIPHSLMATFLTVKEAAQLIGKSPSSIRRILYPILEDDNHPDRHHIEPDPEAARALRLKGENFPWKISEELLRREAGTGSAKPTGTPRPAGADVSDQSATIIEMLRSELEIKNQQIASLNDLTKGLSERLREGNILMGSLQKQLSLGEGSGRRTSDVVDADTRTATEKGTKRSPADPEKKKHWLFRKIF